MKLNVSKVLAAEKERKARVVPLPRIRSKKQEARSNEPETEKPVLMDFRTSGLPLIIEEREVKDILPKDSALLLLEIEMRALKVERAKLSNSIPALIEEVASSLRKESPGVADEFLKGNIPDYRVKQRYQEIQSVTEQMMKVYDKIRHVEMYGALPAPVETQNIASTPNQSEEAKALKYEIRRLDDLIYKCHDKIKKANSGLKAPKNSERINTWRTTIAMAEVKRDDLKMKLKQLRNEGRS